MGISYPRILTPPKGSFFLFGMRGVGKSTWTEATFPKAHVVDLLDEARHQELLASPGGFGAELRTLPRGATVVVDEIQRVPALLNEVHRAIERHRFVMLGSSARRLKTAGTNLLAGRAVWKTLLPLLPAELGDDFDLASVLRFGAIPLVWAADDRDATLRAYVQLYVREEIRAEALVRNLPAFLRFLQVAALFHGQVINVSSVARDASTSRTTVDGYLQILEDTLLTFSLPAYEARLRVRERKHPKLYFTDPGVARAAKKQLGPVAVEERGALLEGYVLTMLRAHHEARALFEDIAYWAPSQAMQTEVDFLLRRGDEFCAIEVKSGSRWGAKELKGLTTIAALPKVVRRILVTTGERPQRTQDGIDILPLRHFSDVLADDALWP